MKTESFEVQKGDCIIYDDERPDHKNIMAVVLSVDCSGINVLFDDRADTTRIMFSDRSWMDFLRVAR